MKKLLYFYIVALGSSAAFAGDTLRSHNANFQIFIHYGRQVNQQGDPIRTIVLRPTAGVPHPDALRAGSFNLKDGATIYEIDPNNLNETSVLLPDGDVVKLMDFPLDQFAKILD